MLDGAKEEFERTYVLPKEGRTLICGSHLYGEFKQDRRELYHNCVGADQEAGPGVDLVVDLEQPQVELGKFTHVDCLSVLEHAKRPWLIARTIERVLEPGGTLYLLVPFTWRVHAYPSDYWRFTVEGVQLIFPRIAWSRIGYIHDRYVKRVAGIDHGGFPYMPRSEVIGFGALR